MHLPACLYSLLAQTRPPDEILIINNASTDETGAVARAIPGVRVVDEPAKGLVIARETARRAARRYRHFSVTQDVFGAYLDEISSEAVRAKRLYNMLVIPGAEITQNHIRSKKNSHIIALRAGVHQRRSVCGRHP
jgi:glycosyltransferase involved in cell wall biosynthesis